MLSKELVPLLIQVISSWQVLAVTIAILLYFSLVFFVARTRGRSRSASYHSRPKKKKPQKAKQGPVSAEDEINEELGLEEG